MCGQQLVRVVLLRLTVLLTFLRNEHIRGQFQLRHQGTILFGNNNRVASEPSD